MFASIRLRRIFAFSLFLYTIRARFIGRHGDGWTHIINIGGARTRPLVSLEINLRKLRSYNLSPRLLFYEEERSFVFDNTCMDTQVSSCIGVEFIYQ